MFPVYYIFNFLMTLLLVLHVFWYYLITLIAYRVGPLPPPNICKTILNLQFQKYEIKTSKLKTNGLVINNLTKK